MKKKQIILLLTFLIGINTINIYLAILIHSRIYTYNYQRLKEPVSSEFKNKDSHESKRVAITFDDGPHPVYTLKLLDGLKERGVTATFFVLGKNIEGNEEIIKRMSEEGHTIGNHTYSHIDLTSVSKERLINEIEKGNELIYNITGKYPVLIRPPYGKYTKKIISQINMILALWTVDPSDSLVNKSTERLTNFIVKNTEDEDIILLHDIFEKSVDAALNAIDELQKEGYSFVNLEDMILD